MLPDRQPRLQPRLDPISIIILVVVLGLVAMAILFLQHRFAATQHHTTVLFGKPDAKKQLPQR